MPTVVVKTCLLCGKEFKKTLKAWNQRKTQTCSVSCAQRFVGKSHWVVLKCAFCGKVFKRIKGAVRQAQRHFCSRACHYKDNKEYRRGKRAGNWRGGFWHCNGYCYVYKPKHPNANKHGYIKQERLIAEMMLGRYLDRKEIVHHIDGDKRNNTFRNLLVCSNRSIHTKMHLQMRWGGA